jgi:hypothetical protein
MVGLVVVLLDIYLALSIPQSLVGLALLVKVLMVGLVTIINLLLTAINLWLLAVAVELVVSVKTVELVQAQYLAHLAMAVQGYTLT